MVDGVPVWYFKRLTGDHSHFSPALLRAVWTEVKQSDVIHIHAWWNLVSVLSCFIALLRRRPVVISPRGTLSAYSFHNKNSFYKKLIHYLLGKHLLNNSFIHVTSVREKDRLGYLIRHKNIIDIPNFISLPVSFPARSYTDQGKLKLLFLSRIEEKKGLDILLHALKAVTVAYSLTIAGNGELAYIDSLKQIITENELTDHVTWIGFQDEQKFQVLSDHDLLILPSHDENFGNVVIESLGVGTPVLISEQVGLADYVAANNLGRVCRTDPASVAALINNTDREKLAAIRNRAPGVISAGFNENNLVQQYIAMYHQTIQNG